MFGDFLSFAKWSHIESFRALAEYMVHVANDPDLRRLYYEWIPRYHVVKRGDIGFCALCNYLHSEEAIYDRKSYRLVKSICHRVIIQAIDRQTQFKDDEAQYFSLMSGGTIKYLVYVCNEL